MPLGGNPVGWGYLGQGWAGGSTTVPVNTVAPVVSSSGTVYIGSVFTVAPGTWTNAASGYLYQWQRDNAGDGVYTDIAGSRGATYTLVAADISCNIRVAVYAANLAGIVGVYSNALLGPAPDVAHGIICQIAFADAPTVGSPTWVDVTPLVLNYVIQRGKQRQLDRFESGTMQITLRNTNRALEPAYAASPHYPNVVPLRQIRFGFVLNGVTYWKFRGYIERWPQKYKGPTWTQVDLTCVDTFEVLRNRALVSAYAAYTTVLGTNKDLVYTSAVLGFVGNSTTITYAVAGLNTALSVSVAGVDITVHVATNGAGAATSTASQVMTAVNADPVADQLVVVTLAPGSDGSGVVAAMAAKNLAGGTYVQQLSGARATTVLDQIAWPADLRLVSAGTKQVQATAVPADGSVSALDHLYAVEASERGALFADGQGRVVFIDSSALAAATYTQSLITLVDGNPQSATEFSYQDVGADYDKDLIYNDIRITNVGGTVQVASDTPSQAAYFKRTYSAAPILTTDAAALAMAQELLIRFKSPGIRFQPLKLFPGTNLDFWANLLQRELMDTATVKRTPPGGGAPIVATGTIISLRIEGQAGPVVNTVWTVQVDPSILLNYFILDDPVHGVLDAGNVLAA